LLAGYRPRRELLERVESRDHALYCVDLQNDWPLSQRLAPACADLQSVLQIGDICAERDSSPVCGHIHGVYDLAVKILVITLRLGGRGPRGAVVSPLDQGRRRQ